MPNSAPNYQQQVEEILRQKIEETNLRINKLMSSAVEEKKEPDEILDEDPDTDMNLQHLLRATNHLQIAQNEFEKAKKQLQAKGFNIPPELLKMGK